MRMELVDPEGTLRAEIADTRLTRDDVAMTYAMALYIKDKAWRIAESPRKEQR